MHARTHTRIRTHVTTDGRMNARERACTHGRKVSRKPLPPLSESHVACCLSSRFSGIRAARVRERGREIYSMTENERRRGNEEQQYHLLYTTSTTNHHPRTRSRASTDDRHALPTVATRLTRSRSLAARLFIRCHYPTLRCTGESPRESEHARKHATKPSVVAGFNEEDAVDKEDGYLKRSSAFNPGKFLEEWTAF